MGYKRIRTMLVRLLDKMVCLFDNKRKCWSEYGMNAIVLRNNIIRSIRNTKTQGSYDECITWRQYTRVIYLDLNNNTIQMITLGLHSKDYSFNDVMLLEKSYVNESQLHIPVKEKSKMKDYWYEFRSLQTVAEFVRSLIQELPGTLRHRMSNQSSRANSDTSVPDANFNPNNNLNNSGGIKKRQVSYDSSQGQRFSSTDYKRQSFLDMMSPSLTSNPITIASPLSDNNNQNNNNSTSGERQPRLLTSGAGMTLVGGGGSEANRNSLNSSLGDADSYDEKQVISSYRESEVSYANLKMRLLMAK